jgi:hypothetical protein
VMCEAEKHSRGLFIGGGGQFAGEIFLAVRLGFVGANPSFEPMSKLQRQWRIVHVYPLLGWGELERSHGGMASLLGCCRVAEWIRAAMSGGPRRACAYSLR